MSASRGNHSVGSKRHNAFADQPSAYHCAHPDRTPTQLPTVAPSEWLYGDLQQQDTQFEDGRNGLSDQAPAVRWAHPDRYLNKSQASTPFKWNFGDVKQQDTEFKGCNGLSDQVPAVRWAHPDRYLNKSQPSTPFKWNFGDVKKQDTEFKGHNAFTDLLSADLCGHPDRTPTLLPTVAPSEWLYRDLQQQDTQLEDGRNGLSDKVSAVRWAHPDRSLTQSQDSTLFGWDFGDVKQQDTQFKGRKSLSDQVSAVRCAHPDRYLTQSQASTSFEWDFEDVKQQDNEFIDKKLPCIGRPILGRGIMLTKNISGLEYNHDKRVEVPCIPFVNRQEAFMPATVKNVPARKKSSVKEHFERPVKCPVNSYANGSINCFTKYVKAKQVMIPPLNGQENASMSGSVNGQVKKAIKRPLNGRPSGPMKGLVYGHAKEQMKQPLHYFVNSQTNEAIKHPVDGQTNGSFKGSVNGQAKEEMEHPENGHAKHVTHHLVLVNGESMRATKCRKAVEETIDEDAKWERACPTNQTTNLQLKFDLEMEKNSLPFDFNDADIIESFEAYGVFSVDWPYKKENPHGCSPKGFAFLMFQDEHSVQILISHCKRSSNGTYHAQVSSSSYKNKMVEVRPWLLSHAKFIQNKSNKFNHRNTVFVGGISRSTKAHELARFMENKFGTVAYVGIDTDLQLKYPKGSSRVIFEKPESVITAIATRFVSMMEGQLLKKFELKPYILDHQMCDECQGEKSGGRFAPYFCANVVCLKYFCEACWEEFHAKVNLTQHRPTTKHSPMDRPRAMNYK